MSGSLKPSFCGGKKRELTYVSYSQQNPPYSLQPAYYVHCTVPTGSTVYSYIYSNLTVVYSTYDTTLR
jgi:hypothetical protein